MHDVPERICIICDPMLSMMGPARPSFLIARELSNMGFLVELASVCIPSPLRAKLEKFNINPVNLEVKLLTSNFALAYSWLEAWLREALFKLNSRKLKNNINSDVILNFSNTIAYPSTIWYTLGPPSDALKDMEEELPKHYNIIYKIISPLILQLDEKLIRYMASISGAIIAISTFCGSLYKKRGIKVNGVIYAPLECEVFKPTTVKPEEKYALTYIGKETDFTTLKKVADEGVKVKAFGSKGPFIPQRILTHKNIEYLGKVSDRHLIELYSNALFTLFTFTHEPFGYVPVESMACGTPVLTYNQQGPSETVIHNKTGWLVEGRDEMVERAKELWENGFPSRMRKECRRRALEFDVKVITKKWLSVIKESLGNV